VGDRFSWSSSHWTFNEYPFTRKTFCSRFSLEKSAKSYIFSIIKVKYGNTKFTVSEETIIQFYRISSLFLQIQSQRTLRRSEPSKSSFFKHKLNIFLIVTDFSIFNLHGSISAVLLFLTFKNSHALRCLKTN